VDFLRRSADCRQLIVGLGGYSNAAPLIGLFFIIGLVAAPFLPETRGQPLPHALWREVPISSTAD
jgi:hypothetical protein